MNHSHTVGMTFLKIKGWREALLHRTGAKDIFKIILLFSSRHRHFLSFFKNKMFVSGVPKCKQCRLILKQTLKQNVLVFTCQREKTGVTEMRSITFALSYDAMYSSLDIFKKTRWLCSQNRNFSVRARLFTH